MEWKNIYRGILMGISDLMPGVSGGTIAFILGIYDRLLESISGFFSRDDAARAIALYTDLMSRAALDGMTAQMGAAGVDLGALEATPAEDLAEEAAEEATA